MGTAADAFNSARSYLNDINAQIWTDGKLLPHLKEAHRDLQLALWLNGLPVLRERSAVINVAANAVDLGSTQPADLLEPTKVMERTQGSTEDWVHMDETDFEPDIDKATTLKYWAWREEKIVFVGATTNREIKLFYMKSLTLPTTASSTLGFIFAEIFLGPMTAQYASRSVGNSTLADETLSAAREKLDMVIRANVKGQQNLPVRRRPYRRSGRVSLIF